MSLYEGNISMEIYAIKSIDVEKLSSIVLICNKCRVIFRLVGKAKWNCGYWMIIKIVVIKLLCASIQPAWNKFDKLGHRHSKKSHHCISIFHLEISLLFHIIINPPYNRCTAIELKLVGCWYSNVSHMIMRCRFDMIDIKHVIAFALCMLYAICIFMMMSAYKCELINFLSILHTFTQCCGS